jgi:hypothetical protein
MLQRRLEAEHTSFSTVLEEAQRDRCIELLDGAGTLALFSCPADEPGAIDRLSPSPSSPDRRARAKPEGGS